MAQLFFHKVDDSEGSYGDDSVFSGQTKPNRSRPIGDGDSVILKTIRDKFAINKNIGP
jgi:hypothetical protein